MKTKKQIESLQKKCLAHKEKPEHQLEGVYHDPAKQVAVATDGHIAIVSKTTYDPANAGRIIAKDGHSIDGKYPKYEVAFNPLERAYSTYAITIDPDTLLKQVKIYDALRKEKLISNETRVVLDSHAPFVVRGEYAKVMASYNPEGWRTSRYNYKATVNLNDDGMAVVMPTIQNVDCAPDAIIDLYDNYGLYDPLYDHKAIDETAAKIKEVVKSLK